MASRFSHRLMVFPITVLKGASPTMANPEHLAILNRGVEQWNLWREEHPDIHPDLREADLASRDLQGVNLSRANLLRTNLGMANLEDADFNRSYLREANLRGTRLVNSHLIKAEMILVDLCQANLFRASLNAADLSNARSENANLAEADLARADLSAANFNKANLQNTRLRMTTFRQTILDKVEFAQATMAGTVLVDADLTHCRGLAAIQHKGPSSIDLLTLKKSRNLPEEFLQGFGLSNWEIEQSKLFQPDIDADTITDIGYRVTQMRTGAPIQTHSLFISYSRDDSPFVDALEALLDKKGIRFWRDIHDALAGPLEEQVALAMRESTVLLVFSRNSVNSDWVEWEAQNAHKIARSADRHVLCPVALDDSWKSCHWEGRLRQQIEKYNILDFSRWKEPEFLSREFDKLLRGLDLFY